MIFISVIALGIFGDTNGTTRIVEAAEEYEVVWEDEFEGNALDRSIWNVEVNGNGGGNQELQYYRDSTDNIEVSNGTLKIKGKRMGYMGKNYTSGRINTKDKAEFRYGKVEAKMKLPSFQGAWPAFWMLGGNYDEIGWPRCGEIDIMEAINTENFTHGALHWYGEGKRDSGDNAQSVLTENFDRTQWHVYAIEWNERMMNFTVDGKVFFTQDITDGYMGEFRKPQFIILNLAIGGQWPGFTINNNAFPVTMEVDYVRVSQKKSDKGIVTGSGVVERRPSMTPEKVVTRNVLEDNRSWNLYFNQQVVKGSGSSVDSSGYIANIDYLGITSRAINASIRGINYIPGKTYLYSFTMTSDIDKNVLVKVIGEDAEEDVFANCGVSLQAGVPYNFSQYVKIDEDYDGRLDLVVEMGGRTGGEFLDSSSKLQIAMSNASFVGEAGERKEIPTTKEEERDTSEVTVDTTTKDAGNNTVEPTNRTETTLGTPSGTTETTATVKNPAKVIAKSIKNLNGKKVKLTWKKLSGVSGYEITYATNKKFTKNKKTVKVKKAAATSTIIKKLKKKKTYYFKIRAYKTTNGQKKYGAWSKVKKVKIKK